MRRWAALEAFSSGRRRWYEGRSPVWWTALALGGAALLAAAFGGGWLIGRQVLFVPASGAGHPTGSAPAVEASSSPTPGARGRLVVHGTGDVNLDPRYVTSLRTRGYAHPWSGLDDLFTRDSLTIVNLECAASRLGAPEEKAFTFRCDPDALAPMREAGVEVVNLGNNHAGDFGPEALVDARRNLEAAGLAPVGAGVDAEEAYRPAIVEVGGWRVAVLGFGGVIPAREWLAGPGRPGMADGDDIGAMTSAIRAADEEADLVFVTVHWGAELDTEPRPEDVERAHAMIDAGADGIFGHHAHRLQSLDRYRGRPIAWGLGNFVWPPLSAAARRTAVAELVVRPEGGMEACLLAAEIDASGRPILAPEGRSGCPRSGGR